MRGIHGALVTYCLQRHNGDRLRARDCYEEMDGFIYKYARDILDVTAERKTTDRYCIGNICFDTISRKQQFDHIYPGFISFLETAKTLIRAYSATVEIVCCMDTYERYNTTPKRITYRDNVPNPPEESLSEWAHKYAIPAVRAEVQSSGDAKCKALSPSLYLCDWTVHSTRMWEERQ